MLDRNKLYHGDCMELMKQLPDKSVDMILTDVPYGKVNKKSAGLRQFDKGKANVETFDLEGFINECLRLLKGSIYIFCEFEQISTVIESYRKNGLVGERVHVWNKTNPSPANCQYVYLSDIELCGHAKIPGSTFNGHYESCVHNLPAGSSKRHPTEKNKELLKKFIKISSNKGDLILDPCIGSGSTIEACIELKRDWIGMEIDEEYYKLAKSDIKKCIRKNND